MKLFNKKKKRIPIVKQMCQTECGIACCAMVLNYYKSKETLLDIQKELDVGRDGLSIFQMRDYLRKKGLDAKVFKVPNLNRILSCDLPIIIYWEKKHFIVLESLNTGKAIVNDPAIGRIEMSYEKFYSGFSEYILIAEPNETFKPQKKSNEHPWSYIFRELKEKWLLLLFIFCTMIVSYYISIYMAKIVGKIMDDIIKNPTVSVINHYLVVILSIILGYLICTVLKTVKTLSLNIFVSNKLEKNTFKKLLSLPYSYFEKRGSGNILFKVNSVNAVKDLLVSQLLSGILDFGAMVVIGIDMFKKSMSLAITAIIFATIQFMVLCVIKPRIKEAIDVENIEKSKTYGLQMEAVTTISSIKMAGLEQDIFNTWEESYNQSMQKYIDRIKLVNLQSIALGLIKTFAPLIIAIIGFSFSLKGTISLGEVLAFQTIVASFFGLVTSVFSAFTQLMITDTYAKRVYDIWGYNIEKDTGCITRNIDGNILVKDLYYSYTKNSKKVLDNINMNILKGQKVAIVGESGSGKSTLGKVLVGLSEASSGNIYYDGYNVKDYKKKDLLRQIGIVPQDATLFNKSIKDNISLNNSSITMEEIRKAARIACIDSEINNMPMKYETIISDMGQNLSGGQRQRILIARALVKQPKILVMDEATSSLDNVNEEQISRYLSSIGCTRIIIAHRLSTIIDSDVIYMMKDGKIIAYGSHEELLQNCAEYNRLYNGK